MACRMSVPGRLNGKRSSLAKNGKAAFRWGRVIGSFQAQQAKKQQAPFSWRSRTVSTPPSAFSNPTPAPCFENQSILDGNYRVDCQAQTMRRRWTGWPKSAPWPVPGSPAAVDAVERKHSSSRKALETVIPTPPSSRPCNSRASSQAPGRF